jgi:hypothetical protein
MALDPYKRVLKRSQRRSDGKWRRFSRVPYLIGACGLIAMLILAYQLSVTGVNRFIAWQMQ